MSAQQLCGSAALRLHVPVARRAASREARRGSAGPNERRCVGCDREMGGPILRSRSFCAARTDKQKKETKPRPCRWMSALWTNTRGYGAGAKRPERFPLAALLVAGAPVAAADTVALGCAKRSTRLV